MFLAYPDGRLRYSYCCSDSYYQIGTFHELRKGLPAVSKWTWISGKRLEMELKKLFLSCTTLSLLKKMQLLRAKRKEQSIFFCKCLVCELTVVVLSGRTDRQ